jgi:hypothetical protein
MAHLLVPQPLDAQLPVFFNVDGVVGAPPAQNLREDVLLVQFGFKVIADSPVATTGQDVLAAAKAVQVTGNIDAATINAIRTMQQSFKAKNPAQVVDGRVSPARNGYSYGQALWIITHLNNSIQNRHVDSWPRIDKIPACPVELKQMVIRTVAGV